MTTATERRCGSCGELLHARSDAAYCSCACRQRAYRQRVRPRPVDELIAELARITDELERHGLDDEGPAPHESLVFCDGASSALTGLLARLITVKGHLASEERRRGPGQA